jgi:hypothetical protein
MSRSLARADINSVGARLALDGERLLRVVCPPLAPVVNYPWSGLRNIGTDPLAHERDCGDPAALAAVVTAHHDYPDPDWFGQSITD